jgi:HB1, ASXL, restriction endonuclease HTH domain
MTRKHKNGAMTSGDLPALKIGSRVRCTDDGVWGRIVWANAVAVKIQWDDGEQVTWKRDSLASRPSAILENDGDSSAAPAPPTAAEPQPATQPAAPSEQAPEAPTTRPDATQPAATAPQAEPTATAAVATEPLAATTQSAPTEAGDSTNSPAALEPGPVNAEPLTAPTAPLAEAVAPMPDKPKRPRPALAQPKAKKLSALDAAAKVLAEEGRPLTCPELIATMAARGYWTSPGGQTPAATLYSAILRELATKGADARFVKIERGQFARKA